MWQIGRRVRFERRGVGDVGGAIEREVIRRISHTIHPELIKLAVQDAIEPRKPRW
jgi:hypothetical protein